MRLEIGNYVITSDERQFILNEKMIKGEGVKTKEENVGKEYLKPLGYYTNFNDMLKFIPQKALMQSEDTTDLVRLLNQTEEDIKSIEQPIRVEVEKVIVKKVSNKEGHVVISEDEYNELKKDSEKLNALECAGVDNWEGYEIAMSYLCDEEEENEE